MASEKPKVCVLGIWHLGSIVSTCLADVGYTVVGYDPDQKKIDNLNSGSPPIFEPGLSEILTKNISAGRLTYTSNLETAVSAAEFIIFAYDTPVNVNDEVDLSEIFEIAKQSAKFIRNNSIVIISSQVPIGTCMLIKTVIQQNNLAIKIDVVCVPEFLRLGQAIERFLKAKAFIIGANNKDTARRIEKLYAPIGVPLINTNVETAEMCKHAINAFLALPISFVNEIANLSDLLGVDAIKVTEAVKVFLYEDKRIWSKPPLPGLAFSGGTLARDLHVLSNIGAREGYKMKMTEAILAVNSVQNKIVEIKLQRLFGSLNGLTVGALGITYKPGTSTLRRSAAMEIIQGLVSKGVTVKACDPKAAPEEVRLHNEFEFVSNPFEAAKGSDALLLLTEWPEYLNLDFKQFASLMKKQVIIDAKNALNKDLVIKAGFIYSGIGTGTLL